MVVAILMQHRSVSRPTVLHQHLVLRRSCGFERNPVRIGLADQPCTFRQILLTSTEERVVA
jgi:hypothetical protein